VETLDEAFLFGLGALGAAPVFQYREKDFLNKKAVSPANLLQYLQNLICANFLANPSR
jgi:hypothetical protein